MMKNVRDRAVFLVLVLSITSFMLTGCYDDIGNAADYSANGAADIRKNIPVSGSDSFSAEEIPSNYEYRSDARTSVNDSQLNMAKNNERAGMAEGHWRVINQDLTYDFQIYCRFNSKTDYYILKPGQSIQSPEPYNSEDAYTIADGFGKKEKDLQHHRRYAYREVKKGNITWEEDYYWVNGCWTITNTSQYELNIRCRNSPFGDTEDTIAGHSVTAHEIYSWDVTPTDYLPIEVSFNESEAGYVYTKKIGPNIDNHTIIISAEKKALPITRVSVDIFGTVSGKDGIPYVWVQVEDIQTGHWDRWMVWGGKTKSRTVSMPIGYSGIKAYWFDGNSGDFVPVPLIKGDRDNGYTVITDYGKR